MDIMLFIKIICNFVTQGGSRSSSPKGKRNHPLRKQWPT